MLDLHTATSPLGFTVTMNINQWDTSEVLDVVSGWRVCHATVAVTTRWRLVVVVVSLSCRYVNTITPLRNIHAHLLLPRNSFPKSVKWKCSTRVAGREGEVKTWKCRSAAEDVAYPSSCRLHWMQVSRKAERRKELCNGKKTTAHTNLAAIAHSLPEVV